MNKHKQPSTLAPRPSTQQDKQPSTLDSPPSALRPSPPADQNEVLVKVDNVGKLFCRDLKKSLLYGLRDGLGDVVPGIGRKYDAEGNPILRKGEFWANQGISFELRRGECLGLIGHNGAGKTTLLKMLNGLIRPDVGRIEMRGRVGALIALGAGFNPILTGKENVYIAGSVLGLSRAEIDAKYDEIVTFAEMGEFMETPVQNYSSGMQVRLGFAVATAMEPDVLLIDEVLAVGDFAFRQKSLRRISSLLKKAAVIFVSHQEGHVRRICNNALFLSKGIEKFKGDVSNAFDKYNNIEGAVAAQTLGPKIKSLLITTERKETRANDGIKIRITLTAIDGSISFWLRFIIVDDMGNYLAEWNSQKRNKYYDVMEKIETDVVIEKLPLRQGNYFLTTEVLEKDTNFSLAKSSRDITFRLKCPEDNGKFLLHGVQL